MSPVFVEDIPIDRMPVGVPRFGAWQFGFHCTNILPETVEHKACLLLNELLHVYLAYKLELPNIAEVQNHRDKAEILCRDLVIRDHDTIHDVIVRLYFFLEDYVIS